MRTRSIVCQCVFSGCGGQPGASDEVSELGDHSAASQNRTSRRRISNFASSLGNLANCLTAVLKALEWMGERDASRIR